MLAVVVAVLLTAEAPSAPAPPPATAPAPAVVETEAPRSALSDDDAPASPLSKPRVKLLVLDVQSAELEVAQRDTLTSTIAAHATRFAALEVISSQDLRQLADLRADQAATGCEDASSSCMAELANALGAELVLATRAGKLDAVMVVTLQLFDVKKGAAEGRASVQGWSLSEVTDKLDTALDELLERATGQGPTEQGTPTIAAGPRPTAGSSVVSTSLLVGGAVAAAVGLVAGALGATPALLYNGKKQELVQRTATFDGSQEELDRASKLHREANDLRQLYNGVGRFGVIAGALLVPLGGGAVALAMLWPEPTEAGP